MDDHPVSEIKRLYKQIALLIHPDKTQENGAEDAFKKLGQAYEVLGGDDTTRLSYLKKHWKKKKKSNVIIPSSCAQPRRRRTAREIWEEFQREEEVFLQENRTAHQRKKRRRVNVEIDQEFQESIMSTAINKKASVWKQYSSNSSAAIEYCCLLCRRRFTSQEKLTRHEKYSQLHERNLKARHT